MRVFRLGTNRSHPSIIPVLSLLLLAAVVTDAAPLSPDGADEKVLSCDAWEPGTCIDDPCGRLQGKSCAWLGADPETRIPQYCGRPLVRKHCPATCGVPGCTTTTPSPTAAPTDGTYPRGKKGVCYTLRESWEPGSYVENLPKIRALNPSWVYSWGPDPPAGVPTSVLPTGGLEITGDTPGDDDDGIDFVPMLWGYYPDLFEDFTDRMLGPDPRIVLGFNEPDSSSQSNLSVGYALEGWERLADKVTAATTDGSVLVSPSCVQPTGAWCTEFIDTADERGLRLDAIGVHWYGGASPQTLFDKLTETYRRYGNRPILLTEFAVADWTADSVDDNKFTPEQVLDFMKDVLPWLEDTEWILGYAWFSFETDSPPGWVSALVEGTDAATGEVILTPLGQYYSDFQSSS